MADDRTKSNPRNEMPEVAGLVRPLADHELSGTLTTRLIPLVDRIRHLYTRFGQRPYRVFLVHLQWSGRLIGEGSPVVLSRRELLPTPRVLDMSATNEVLRAFGNTEEGGLTVDQISMKYSEDDLLGRTPDLINPATPRTSMKNVEFFWEVSEDNKRIPRRYVPNAVPMIGKDRFQLRISLTKQDSNRARDLSFNRTQA